MSTAAHVIERQRIEGRPDGVVTIGPDATVHEAATLMNEHGIGSLIILDQGERIVGIFTERDILKRVVALARDPLTTRAGDVMTQKVIVCSPETRTEELRFLMKEKKIRHVPVVSEDSRPVGMVSIGDLNSAEVKVMAETIRFLEQYMTRL